MVKMLWFIIMAVAIGSGLTMYWFATRDERNRWLNGHILTWLLIVIAVAVFVFYSGAFVGPIGLLH